MGNVVHVAIEITTNQLDLLLMCPLSHWEFISKLQSEEKQFEYNLYNQHNILLTCFGYYFCLQKPELCVLFLDITMVFT